MQKEHLRVVEGRLIEQLFLVEVRSIDPLVGWDLSYIWDAYCTPTLGMTTTCGSLAFQGAQATRNATVVDMMPSEGMIVLGNANILGCA